MEHLVVLVEVLLLQVVEELAAARCESEEAAACMEVLAVRTKVLGQVSDTRRKEGDLNVARTCVLVVRLEVADDIGFVNCFAFCHLNFGISRNLRFSD